MGNARLLFLVVVLAGCGSSGPAEQTPVSNEACHRAPSGALTLSVTPALTWLTCQRTAPPLTLGMVTR